MKRKKLFLVALLLLVAGALVVFIGVNVADYYRYRYIMNLDKHLTAAEFKEMVQAAKAANVKERKLKRYFGPDIPDAFKKAGAKFALSYDNRVYLELYNYKKSSVSTAPLLKYPAFVQLKIDADDEHPRITLSENFSGWLKERTLWAGDAAYEQQINPKNRIVTVVAWAGGSGKEWIVLQDAILFIDPAGKKLVERKPITILQADAIDGGLDMIPEQLHGKMIHEEIADGAQLEIRFSKDGSPSSDDIIVSNAWSVELEPLLKMLQEFAPHADEIFTKEQMLSPFRHRDYDGSIVEDADIPPPKIDSIEKYRAYPPLETDWWIVWPKLFLEKPKVVLETPPEYR